MIRTSVAFADLALASQSAVGQSSNSLSHPFSLVQLAKAYESAWYQVANDWHLDLPREVLQQATLTHAEMAGDRFVRQMSTLFDSVGSANDAHWTAVTSYYAAFFAAQTLLLMTGRGAMRIAPTLGLPFRGVAAIRSAPSLVAAGHVTLATSTVGAGSHRATWQQSLDLIDEILVNETDARTTLVLSTLKREIRGSDWLSDARNSINYDVTSSPFASGALWSSLLLDLTDPGMVEDELARTLQERPERRFEAVALALGCLATQLRSEFRRRGGRLDNRQTTRRAKVLPKWGWLT